MEGLELILVLLFLLVKIIVPLGIYFTPTIVGIIRKKKDIIAIAALNTLLGWTLLGWVISLVWALKTDAQNQVITQQVIVPSDTKVQSSNSDNQENGSQSSSKT